MSKIFEPFRALGLISSEIPFLVRYITFRKMNFITTVIGNVFHTYSDDKLRLVTVSKPHKAPINCVAGNSKFIFTASGEFVYCWKRGTDLKNAYGPHDSKIIYMLPFGDYLICVTISNILTVWNISTAELFLTLEFSKNFLISCLLHPVPYINKILIGSEQGCMQLWNLHSNKLIFSFKKLDAKINVLVQSPCTDVIAIGLANGRIIVHNIKTDISIVEFRQEWGAVTSISFRQDNVGIMISGSEIGHICIWDLEKKQLSSQIENAHKSPITSLECLPNEPLMVTSSADNTLKMWIFDMPDGGARLHKYCDGHNAPPLVAKFHGSLGDNILTSGEDSSVRMFSTVADILNKSLGRAVYNKKAAKKKGLTCNKHNLPPVIRFTSETAQENPWDDIAAIHRDYCTVTTWSIKNSTMGSLKLRHQRFLDKEHHKTIATCIELSVCGNFVFIGYDSGHIDKYNVQSGLHRGSFGESTAHTSTIRGIVSNAINTEVISGDQTGCLKWWKLDNCTHAFQLSLDCSLNSMCLDRDSNLLACALDDFNIYIIDIAYHTKCRKLLGHVDQITDMTFSSDSRWVISSSDDRTIRTWDLPSGKCVDCFALPLAALSISMSPTDDYLVTVHAGLLGVYLWSNKGCLQQINLCPLSESFVPKMLPIPCSTWEVNEDFDDLEEERMDFEQVEEYQSPEQISTNFITMAQPSSRFISLLDVDIIRRRNKPKGAAKAPAERPFFVPTIPGLEFQFDLSKITDEAETKVDEPSFAAELSPFGKALINENLDESIKYLLDTARPSAVHNEIQNIGVGFGGTEELMSNFLKMVLHFLTIKKHYNAVVMYFGLFNKLHAKYVLTNQSLLELIYLIIPVSENNRKEYLESSNCVLSMISFIQNPSVLPN